MKTSLLTLIAGALLALPALTLPSLAAPKAALPFSVYEEANGNMPWIPSGYMGNTGSIKMNPDHTENPKNGKTCLKVDYTASDNWGGVVWQNPANDWGDKPGGWDLTGAKKLTFWVRGAKGGETVSFQFGLLGKDKPHADSGSGKLDKVKLTTDWKQHTIDLTGVDLSQIKTGFTWVLGSEGSPVTFFLDDIKYE